MKDKSSIIMTITTMDDIKKIKANKNIKYINLDLTKPNLEVIYYLVEHGQGYSYSDKVGDSRGYIYVDYEIFKKSELFILDIINSIPPDLNKLEIAKYLYITIGKNIGYDINILPDKNETVNFQILNTINNIWGSIDKHKGTNVSLTKLYLYLCHILNIDCQLISVGKLGYLKNTITINDKTIITDITQDIPFIQASFQTRYFLGHNDDLELDKKIKYIKDDYSEKKIEQVFKNLNYNDENILKEILINTQNIINANIIKPIELGIIYDKIFTKYCPNYEININNLFINNNNQKKHFILISYNNRYYSYNYIRKSFVEITYDEIEKNIEDNKVGIYLNERNPNFNQKVVLS